MIGDQPRDEADATEGLQRDLERNKFATDNSSDAIYWVREDSQFLYVNRAACEMLGYTREELLQRGVVDIDPDYPADVWAAWWSHMKRVRFESIETRHTDAEGERRWVSMAIHFYQHGEDEFIVGTSSSPLETNRRSSWPSDTSPFRHAAAFDPVRNRIVGSGKGAFDMVSPTCRRSRRLATRGGAPRGCRRHRGRGLVIR